MSNITTLDDMRRDAGSLLQSVIILLGDYELSDEEKTYLKETKRKLTNITNELRMMQSNRTSSYGGNESFTLEEIATKFGITRERVRQVESSAIKKLKHPKLGRKLRQYLADEYGDIPTNTINHGKVTPLS